MVVKTDDSRNTKKLGNNSDPFSLDDLPEIIKEHGKKPKPKNEYNAYPRQKMIKGRPYYYLVWYVKDDQGKRRQKSIYLGTTLLKGYSLGKPIKIASAR